jgi:F-type H+-transporting ATPase subunit delta
VADLGIRYATALFEISEEGGLLNEYLEQSKLLCSALNNVDTIRFLTHPQISADEKIASLSTAFGDSIHQDLFSFMKLAITKNREAYLLPALSRLVEMIKVRNNQTTARIVSAVSLTEEQVAQLTATLTRKLGKIVEITVVEDPSVIAGISIHVDGYFLDRTVKTMLKDMRESIKSNREGASA